MVALEKIFDISNLASNVSDRYKIEVLAQTMEEVGELSTEIAIDNGTKKSKEHGEDGIVGEACDAIITLLDIIYLSKDWGSYEEFKDVVDKTLDNKSGKWKDNVISGVALSILEDYPPKNKTGYSLDEINLIYRLVSARIQIDEDNFYKSIYENVIQIEGKVFRSSEDVYNALMFGAVEPNTMVYS